MSTSSSSWSSPRYDLSLNPPYQINYRAKRAGKHISASKRRITFQFGFSSARAIAAGHTEVECRGEEHEVVLVWSHMTGKRQLFMDGREIHTSKAARGNTKFEYSWGILGGHIMKIIANGTPPTGEKAQWQRQFDLELDGMSFFDFSKIYELGRGGNGGRRHNTASMKKELPAVGYSYRGTAYETRDDAEEEEYYDDSLQQQQPHPVQDVKVDLFDMQQPPSQMIVSPMTQYNSIPSLVGSTTSVTSSNSSFDEFTPVEYTSNNNQKPYKAISNEILCAYGNAAPPAPVNSAPSSSRALVPVSEEGMDVITRTMKNLVNLDDITTTPVQPLSIKAPPKSPAQKAVPSWALIGREPTLAEIRDSANTVQSPSPGQDAWRTQPVGQQQEQQQYQQYPVAMQYQQAHPHGLAAYQGAASQSYGYQYGTQASNMGYPQAY